MELIRLTLRAALIAGLACAAAQAAPPAMSAADQAYYDEMKANSDQYYRERLKGPPSVVDGYMLNPKIQFHLENWQPMIPQKFGVVLSSPEIVAQVRSSVDANWAGRTARTEEMAKTEDRTVPGPAGDIQIRIYWPKVTGNPDEKLPIVVYFHGGGWLSGSIESHDPMARLLANYGQVIVVSSNYRMAPEHHFPAAQDDGEAAYRYVRDHAAEIGGDASRVAIGGDSAGGNIAMSVIHRAVTAGEKIPPYALLYYAALDVSRSVSYRSYQTLGRNFGLDLNYADWVIDNYFPDVATRTSPDASILLAPSLKGFPPALIAVGGLDMLRDQNTALATRLVEEKIAVDYKVYPSLVHSFLQHSYAVDDAFQASVETAVLFGKRIREAPGN